MGVIIFLMVVIGFFSYNRKVINMLKERCDFIIIDPQDRHLRGVNIRALSKNSSNRGCFDRIAEIHRGDFGDCQDTLAMLAALTII